MRISRCLSLVIPLALASGAITACGTDDRASDDTRSISGDSAPADTTTSSTLTTPSGTASDDADLDAVGTYQAWLRALADRDAAAACRLHAPQFTIDLRYQAILLDRAELGDPCTGFVAVLWEESDREFDPLDIEATRVTEEDATLAVDFPTQDVTVTLAYHRAAWRILDTSPRADDGPGQPGDPDRWVQGWCAAEVGMTRDELIELMGPASGEYTVGNGGEPQLYWTQDQYDFRAYFATDADSSGAIDLVGDYDALTRSERATLDCPELR